MQMNPSSRRQLGRYDRHVRRGRLSLGAGAPSRKLTLAAEESLRLSQLPGEDQGRVYYFRRVHVRELPEDGDRRAWLNAFQAALREQASKAVHGSDPCASAADAVFFHSEQQACEMLLVTIASRVMPLAWYWRHVSGLDRVSTAAIELVAVVEKLLATPAAWAAVAAAILYVDQSRDVLTLLKSIPEEAASHWLRELGAAGGAYAVPIRFSKPVVAMLVRVMAAFPPEAPVVLWLAALAVISAQPASVENRSSVRIARASLRAILAEQASIPQAKALPEFCPMSTLQPAPHTGETSTAEAPQAEGAIFNEPPALLASARQAMPSSNLVTQRSSAIEASIRSEKIGPALEVRQALYFGEPSSGAGLFFLLNVLRHLEFEKQGNSLLFLAQLMRYFASHAGIEAGDPILRWAHAVEQQSEPEQIEQRSLRIWLIRTRRWCWKNGRISVREIVNRSGYVTLTRTDLDVTLSIDSADIRIRRIGLDLDPGWLPWFGRVVRFHYRYRGEFCG
jgi:hypothetical protein